MRIGKKQRLRPSVENTANIAVLASGTGSNLEAILGAGVPVALVLADRPSRALEIAEAAGVPAKLITRSFGKEFDREAYTSQVLEVLRAYDIDLIAMAGWMTVFAPALFKEYGGKILNTHPSLLPLFKGDKAVEGALAAGATETGCTIHVATEDLDAGPILAQAKVPVLPGDTVETLHERIKIEERKLYPKVLLDIRSGALALPSARG